MKSKIPASLRVIGQAFVDWWDGWLDMVLTTIVWILAQLTIILGPPATFGLYYVVHQMINGEALSVKGMISGGRKYFWKAWIWGSLNLLVMIIFFVNINFYGSISAGWAPYLQVIVIMIGFLWYCTQFYAIPYFFEQETKNLFVAFRNGLFTTLAAPFFTLLIMVVVIVILGVSVGLVIPVFLGLPAVAPFLGFRAMYNRLEVFGLRQPEKTPRELEFEESGKIKVPGLNLSSNDLSLASDEVADSVGDIEQGK